MLTSYRCNSGGSLMPFAAIVGRQTKISVLNILNDAPGVPVVRWREHTIQNWRLICQELVTRIYVHWMNRAREVFSIGTVLTNSGNITPRSGC